MNNKERKIEAPSLPRLCHIKTDPDFSGYGFNLHTIKGRTGQFVGKVDLESPADRAQLKEGDRLIEVNGVNITTENHKNVVERIQMLPNETYLLVVDSVADMWYADNNVQLSSRLPEVLQCYSTRRTPPKNQSNADAKDVDSNGKDIKKEYKMKKKAESEEDEESEEDQEDDGKVVEGAAIEPVLVSQKTFRYSKDLSEEPDSQPSSIEKQTRDTSRGCDDLLLPSSAAEMKRILASRKKKDLRTCEIALSEKYDIIQSM